MRQRWMKLALAAVCVTLLAVPALAQSFGSITGVCKDADGKPIAGAVVQMVSSDSGRKYELKTDSKGSYFSLGISPETYTVKLLKDGQMLDSVRGFHVQLGDNNLDFDLKKSAVQAAQQQGISAEKLKQMQDAQEKAKKQNDVVKQLNEKIAASTEATKAGDFQGAINTLTEATQLDASYDIIWFKLGDAYRNFATKQTGDEKTKSLASAVEDYQKALDIKKKAMATSSKPEDAKTVASYYNNLGETLAMQGNADGAKAAYEQAAQLDPTGSGQYYFNMGAVLTNANTANDPALRKAAVEAFDKSIAADPNRADSYYWKGTNLIGMAVLKGDTMVAPDGTAEAFQKYLTLKPDGPHAEEAKAMLQSIGAPVETSFGKSKKSTKK
jgi:tetratricopeptide (TPR) repeat protein